MFSQACVSHSVHKQPHGYAVTAHACCGGRYASYWNAFLFYIEYFAKINMKFCRIGGKD